MVLKCVMHWGGEGEAGRSRKKSLIMTLKTAWEFSRCRGREKAFWTLGQACAKVLR